MTMHTRYRAAMQQALGEVVEAVRDGTAATSAVGTEALLRLEREGFTLTALPVDERPTEPTEADPPCDDPDCGAAKLDGHSHPGEMVGGRPAAPTPEAVAQHFHETYERLAPSFGYETRKASAVPWDDVPDKNKRLMIAVAGEVVALLSRPAADTPAVIDETVTVEALPGGAPAAPGQSFITSRMVDALPGTSVQIVECGVAAEPKEHGDGD